MDVLRLIARVRVVAPTETLGRATTEEDDEGLLVMLPCTMSPGEIADTAARICARRLPELAANDLRAPPESAVLTRRFGAS